MAHRTHHGDTMATPWLFDSAMEARERHRDAMVLLPRHGSTMVTP